MISFFKIEFEFREYLTHVGYRGWFWKFWHNFLDILKFQIIYWITVETRNKKFSSANSDLCSNSYVKPLLFKIKALYSFILCFRHDEQISLSIWDINLYSSLTQSNILIFTNNLDSDLDKKQFWDFPLINQFEFWKLLSKSFRLETTTL